MPQHGRTCPLTATFDQRIDDDEMLFAGLYDARRQALNLAEPGSAVQVVNEGPKESVAGCRRDHIVQLKVNREMLFQRGLLAGEIPLNPLLELQKVGRGNGRGGLLSRYAFQEPPEIQNFQ